MKTSAFNRYLLLLFIFFMPAGLLQVHAQIITTIANVANARGFGGDDGPAAYAKFYHPVGMAIDAVGNVYIADEYNNRVRKMDPFGIVTTFAGTGVAGYSGDSGLAIKAKLNAPGYVAVDGQGNVYISDINNDRIRRVNTKGIIETVVGNGIRGFSGDGGPAINAELNLPQGIAIDMFGQLYIAGDGIVRKVDTGSIITTYAGTLNPGYTGDGGPATAARFIQTTGVAIDSQFNLYVTDVDCHVVRKIDIFGTVTTIAGRRSYLGSDPLGDDGPATRAILYDPTDVKLDNAGNIYITDGGTNSLRKIDKTGIITTVCGDNKPLKSGDGGLAVKAGLYAPLGLVIDNDNNIYISESNNDVRFIFGTTPSNTFCKLYPNPSYNGQVKVLFTSSYDEMVTVHVANQLGEVVYKNTIPTNFNLDIRLEPTGIYFLSGTSAHGKWKQEISIVR